MFECFHRNTLLYDWWETLVISPLLPFVCTWQYPDNRIVARAIACVFFKILVNRNALCTFTQDCLEQPWQSDSSTPKIPIFYFAASFFEQIIHRPQSGGAELLISNNAPYNISKHFALVFTSMVFSANSFIHPHP